MQRPITFLATALLASTAIPAIAAADIARVTTDLNMRAGPSPAFPVVTVLPDGATVNVFGCVRGYSWCDVSWDGRRGWASANYLTQPYQGSYVSIVEYGPRIDVPIIGFSIGSYWDDYYRSEPWYGRRDRWRSVWHGNDHRRHRAERREHRRDNRAERRKGRQDFRADRREARQDRRVERRQERQQRSEQRRERQQEQRAERRGDRRQEVRTERRIERRQERRAEQRPNVQERRAERRNGGSDRQIRRDGGNRGREARGGSERRERGRGG
jgi:uncharacterized protein YraI